MAVKEHAGNVFAHLRIDDITLGGQEREPTHAAAGDVFLTKRTIE